MKSFTTTFLLLGLCTSGCATHPSPRPAAAQPRRQEVQHPSDSEIGATLFPEATARLSSLLKIGMTRPAPSTSGRWRVFRT